MALCNHTNCPQRTGGGQAGASHHLGPCGLKPRLQFPLFIPCSLASLQTFLKSAVMCVCACMYGAGEGLSKSHPLVLQLRLGGAPSL